MKKIAPYLVIGIFSLLFISRFFFFMTTQDAGIEHDSGWYLGVARNVAERGIYASFVNTIDKAGSRAGAYPSIHRRFSVQDEKGYSYFPAGVTVGPGFILPEAAIIKMFGAGWIQYRIIPFLSFCILVVLLFFSVYRFGGWVGFAFFAVWMWFYPQIWVNQSFEAFSEHLALLYLIAGFLFLSRKKTSTSSLVLGGLFTGFAIQTKTLFFLAVPPVLLLHLIWEKNIKKTILLALSIALPTILFEAYRFISLFSRFGMEGYQAINKDNYLTMKTSGSGMGIFKTGLSQLFVTAKIYAWKHVGMIPATLPIPFIPLLYAKKAVPRFLVIVVSGFFVFFSWFVFLSSTGWFRHAFPGILLGMVGISLAYGVLVRFLIGKKEYVVLTLVVTGLFFGIFQMVSSPLSIVSYRITRQALEETKEYVVNGLQGPFFIPVFSQRDQEDVSKYILSSVPAKRKLCYRGGFLVAELPALVDRVVYPLARCGTGDMLVIGPYQRGRYNLLGLGSDYDSFLKGNCGGTPYKNPSYLLCVLK